MLRGSVAPSYLRATEPLSCIIITKIARNFLIKPEALCSESLHKPLISRDQGVAGTDAESLPWSKEKHEAEKIKTDYGENDNDCGEL